MKRKVTKARSQRQFRVGEEIKHVISALFERGALNHPDLYGKSITVSEVQVSPDLHNATVYFYPFGNEVLDMQKIYKALNHSSGYVRSYVGKNVALPYIPKLYFVIDDIFDKGQSLQALFSDPVVVSDLSKEVD